MRAVSLGMRGVCYCDVVFGTRVDDRRCCVVDFVQIDVRFGGLSSNARVSSSTNILLHFGLAERRRKDCLRGDRQTGRKRDLFIGLQRLVLSSEIYFALT